LRPICSVIGDDRLPTQTVSRPTVYAVVPHIAVEIRR